MQMTLSDIGALAVAFNQGRNDYSPSELSLYANIALTEIATRQRYRATESLLTFSTSSGSNTLRLASVVSDLDYVVGMSNLSTTFQWGGGGMVQVDPTWIDSQVSTSGVPMHYAVYGGGILLHPSPNSAYSIQVRYVQKIPTMIASTDTPRLDERYHFPVALRTAALCAAARNDVEQEAINQARYLSAMGSTPSDTAYMQQNKQGMGVRVPRHRW